MNTIEIIHARHSVGNLKSDPVPRELVETLLDAGAQAPNHHRVRPWRFIVVSGEARRGLGVVMAESLRRRNPQCAPEALEREKAKPGRAPVIIAVGVDQPAEPRVLEIENVCAAAAACENILLAATELGLASHWRTGDAATDQDVKSFLGLMPEQQLIAFLYIGYPNVVPDRPNRPGFQDRTIWMA